MIVKSYIFLGWHGRNHIHKDIKENAEILLEKLSPIFTNDKIEKYSYDKYSNLDPDYADGSEIPEYQLYLRGLRHRIFLFIIADIYYSLEKKISYWIYEKTFNEIGYKHITSDQKDKKIHNLDLIKFIKIFKVLGWNIENKTFWETIEKYRLLVNCYKHGYGTSYEKLKKETKQFFECEYHNHSHSDEPSLCVKKEDIDIFLNAIKDFFKEMPDLSINSEGEIIKINDIISGKK